MRQAAAKGQPAKGPHSAPADKRVLAEEHRKNISAAIRQKWADPEYRMRALSGMKSGVVQAKRQSTGRVKFLIAWYSLLSDFKFSAYIIILDFQLYSTPCMHACVAAIVCSAIRRCQL